MKHRNQINFLKRYLRIRNITPGDIEAATGINYHTIYRTITGERTARTVREAIAKFLDLEYRQTWGISAPRELKKLINAEIENQTNRHRSDLRGRFLNAS